MKLLPLGVGDAFSALRYSSCLAVEAGGEWLLIDCPHPIQKMMREAAQKAAVALSPADISAVVLTHLHADHSSGLEGLGYYSYFYLRRKLPLIAHPAVLARLWEGHLAAGMEQLLPAVGAPFVEKTFDDYFAPKELREGGALAFGRFSIECKRTIHHIPTTALRISAGGRRLGHSADTAFDEGLISWLAEADLVIHETNYGVHTPYEKLAALPAEVRAKMRLNHYPDDFELEKSAIEPLVEGRLYEV
jgi:ribonuclease BN (tRNA processing enzyme)